MSVQDHNSFTRSPALPLLSIEAIRLSLLAEMDRRMAAQVTGRPHGAGFYRARPNCPEHLYSIDREKMEAARLLNA